MRIWWERRGFCSFPSTWKLCHSLGLESFTCISGNKAIYSDSRTLFPPPYSPVNSIRFYNSRFSLCSQHQFSFGSLSLSIIASENIMLFVWASQVFSHLDTVFLISSVLWTASLQKYHSSSKHALCPLVIQNSDMWWLPCPWAMRESLWADWGL